MNISKTNRNIYKTLSTTYSGGGDHEKTEYFGSFSISAAVRPHYRCQETKNPNAVQDPKIS